MTGFITVLIQQDIITAKATIPVENVAYLIKNEHRQIRGNTIIQIKSPAAMIGIVEEFDIVDAMYRKVLAEGGTAVSPEVDKKDNQPQNGKESGITICR